MTCSTCQVEEARKGQRTCATCHKAYMRNYRKEAAERRKAEREREFKKGFAAGVDASKTALSHLAVEPKMSGY